MPPARWARPASPSTDPTARGRAGRPTEAGGRPTRHTPAAAVPTAARLGASSWRAEPGSPQYGLPDTRRHELLEGRGDVGVRASGDHGDRILAPRVFRRRDRYADDARS